MVLCEIDELFFNLSRDMMFSQKILQLGRIEHMAYKITDDCINCGLCIDECAVQAISEGDGKHVIDPDKCIDCGICADACTSNAIVQD